ncbi:hypothetical protein R5R35_013572 [Gryllus longicercus]|uniref:Accessory gland protein n=1 Tax=Gryllus longicercus TaxID=2509291 RepID=A0AAN9VJG4_9ORTH
MRSRRPLWLVLVVQVVLVAAAETEEELRTSALKEDPRCSPALSSGPAPLLGRMDRELGALQAAAADVTWRLGGADEVEIFRFF